MGGGRADSIGAPTDGLPLSVVMVIGAARARAQRSLDALVAQTAIDRIEIIVVDMRPDLGPLRSPSDCRVRTINSPRSHGWGAAREAGLRAARGDAVAFIEEHCFAETGWAAALIDAHAGPWVVVGYGFRNANSQSYVSRCAMITDYGPWLLPTIRGERTLLPGNNISYNRQALMSLGGLVSDAMVNDFVAVESFRKRGSPMFIETGAVVAHLNFHTVWETGVTNYLWGRVMASRRADALGWSTTRRLLWGLLTPTGEPVFRFARLAGVALAGGPKKLAAYLLATPVIVAVSAFAAAGQTLGYLHGAGRSEELLTKWEVDVERQ
jgi:hypothetical protein